MQCGKGIKNRLSEKSLEAFEMSGHDKVGHKMCIFWVDNRHLEIIAQNGISCLF